jgi:hypothetical protein
MAWGGRAGAGGIIEPGGDGHSLRVVTPHCNEGNGNRQHNGAIPHNRNDPRLRRESCRNDFPDNRWPECHRQDRRYSHCWNPARNRRNANRCPCRRVVRAPFGPEHTLRTHQRQWPLAALLLLLAAGWPGGLDADSPQWADEQMLLPWPSALGATLPADEPMAASPDVGRPVVADALLPFGHSIPTVVTASDEGESPADVAPAGWWHAAAPLSDDCGDCRAPDWILLPAGILYKSYIAGEKEPRMGAAWLVEKDRGVVLEEAIGGRLGLLRYGTPGAIYAQGFQWDLEAAAFLRQDPEQELDVEATDFRIGSVLTWRRQASAVKFGYYHLSSHLGDEFLLRNPMYPRLNYVRDAVLFGVRQHLRPDLQVYGEIAWAFKTDGGAEPLELQFGAEYNAVDATGDSNGPFAAVNGHLREEFDFGGSLNVIAGWEWRGRHSNRRLRIGGQFYNGKEIQWSFYDESVSFAGAGIWYDF